MARWGFPLLVFAPAVVMQLPVDPALFREMAWVVDVVLALVVGGCVVALWSRGRARLRPWQPLLLLMLAFVASGLLVITEPIEARWPISASWTVAMIGALCAAWAPPWPQGRALLGIAALAALAAGLSPLLSGWVVGAYLLPLMVLFAAVALGVGLVIHSNRESHDAARATIAERERRLMAAELHDLVAHEITGIVVLTQAARQRDHDPTTAAALQRVEDAGHRAMGHIRTLVADTAQPNSATAHDLDDLNDLVARFAESCPATVIWRADEAHGVHPRTIRAAHRILSEALTNVRRHAASAERVELTLRVASDVVTLSVEDDGHGGGLGSGAGSGLAGVVERAALVGGTVEYGVRPEGGWRVTATLPRHGGAVAP